MDRVDRASFTLRSGTITGQMFVSVTPPGRLLFSGGPQSMSSIDLILVNTHLTKRRKVATTAGRQSYAFPAWSADARQVFVLETGPAGQPHVVAYDSTAGTSSFPNDTAVFTMSYPPSY